MMSDSRNTPGNESDAIDSMETLELVSKKLRRRGYHVKIFTDSASAADEVRQAVAGKTVGHGSSMTLEALHLTEGLQDCTKAIFSHTPGEAGENERNALTADVFLTSVNAMSMDGQIVNIDGTGNRVAATCFGPRHVIFVVGINKIVESLEDAHSRARNSAVKLAAHYGRSTPCTKTGVCTDCLSAECICSITTVHRKNPLGALTSVFLVNEVLGL